MTTVVISSQLWEEGKKLFEDDVGISQGDRQQDSTTLQQTIESLKHASTKASKEYGEHSIKKDKKPIITIKLDRIMKRLEVLMQIGDAYIGCAPETVSLVWMSFRMIFTGFLKDAATCAWLTDAVDQMTDIMFVCNVFEQRYLKANGIIDAANVAKDRVLAMIPPLYAAVMKFSYQSRKLFSHGKLARSFLSWRSVELEDTLGDAQAKRAKLQETAGIGFQEATLDTLEALKVDTAVIHGVFEVLQSEVVAGIKDIQADQAKSKETQRKADIEKKYLEQGEWLKSGPIAHLAAPARVQEANVKKTHPGSTDWLLESHDFKRWRDHPSGSVAWLFGKGGLGKSFLVSSMVDHVRSGDHRWSNNRSHVIFFYCKKGDQASSVGTRVFVHLLLQLYERAGQSGTALDTKEKFAKLVEEAQKKSTNTDHKHDPTLMSMKSAFVPLFKELVQALELPVFVFVDALDECDNDEGQFIQALLQLSDTSNLHLMLTSRPEVTQELKRPDDIRIRYIEVNTAQTQAEIAKYVKSKIKSIKRFTPPMRKKACLRIAKNSDGSFRYADVVLDSLSLPQAKTTPFNQLLDSLPGTMNALYKQSMSSLDPSLRKMLITALRWLMCSSDQITIDMIADEIEGRWDYVEQDEDIETSEEIDNDDFGSDDDESDFASDTESEVSVQNGREPTPYNDQGVRRDIEKELQEAGRDFLVIDQRYRTINVQHNSVRDFILSEQEAFKHEKERCEYCRKRFQETLAYEAGPEYGNLLICHSLVRRLNNLEFQKRFILHLPPSRRSSVTGDQSVSSKHTAPGSASGSVTGGEGDDQIPEDKASPVHNDETLDKTNNSQPELDEGNPPSPGIIASPQLSRRSSVAYPENLPPPSFPPPHYGNRYEVQEWPKHFRQLEEVTKTKPEGWDALYDDLEKFVDPESLVYKDWLQRYWPWRVFEVAETPLHIAARFGILELVQRYLDRGKPTINERNELEETPLHVACDGDGNFRGIELLCSKGADVHALNSKKETPLHVLLQNKGNASDVEALLKAGAKIDVLDEWGTAPIHLAAQNCNIEAMKALLGVEGADVNFKDGTRGETPLHWAWRTQNPPAEFLEFLFEKGALVNEQDFDSQGPLYEACTYGDSAGAAVLLKHGADIDDDEDVFGHTALHAAIQASSPETVKVLIDAGANLELKNKNGETVLHQVANVNQPDMFDMVASVLTQKGLFKDMCLVHENLYGRTPLHMATDLETCQKILEKGDAPTLLANKDRDGNTPLHSAAEKYYPAAIKGLLDAGADPTLRNNDGVTPAELAIARLGASSSWSPPVSDVVHSNLILADRAPETIKMPDLLNIDIELEVETPLCEMFKHFYQLEDEHAWTPLAFAEHLKKQYKLDLLLKDQKNVPEARKVVGHRPSALRPNSFNPMSRSGTRSFNFELSEDKLEILDISVFEVLEDGPVKAEESEDDSSPDHATQANDPSTIENQEHSVDQGHIQPADEKSEAISDSQTHDQSGVEKDEGEEHSIHDNPSVMDETNYRVAAGEIFMSDHPTPACMPVYYFEIEILSGPDSQLGMNFGLLHEKLSSEEEYDTYAYGSYHAYEENDQFTVFTNIPLRNTPQDAPKFPYNKGDIVGCGYDWEAETVFFTKNGSLLSERMLDQVRGKLFPYVIIFNLDVRVRFNFGNDTGKPFKYQDSAKTLAEKGIKAAPVSNPGTPSVTVVETIEPQPLSRSNTARSESIGETKEDSLHDIYDPWLRFSGHFTVPKYTMKSALEAAKSPPVQPLVPPV